MMQEIEFQKCKNFQILKFHFQLRHEGDIHTVKAIQSILKLNKFATDKIEREKRAAPPCVSQNTVSVN